MRIGSVQLKSDLILAPAAGYSDVGFRAVCREFGAGLCVTEMVSMKGLKYGNENTKALLVKEPDESPSAVQIFGSDPDIMAEMCLTPEIQAFDIVDINMGCPMPKIYNNGEGCALMGDIKLAAKIISAVRKNVKTLTVKFRSGIDQNSISAPEFAKICEGAGADAVTVHARTREQYYGGAADWRVIANVVQNVKIPVVGNGDVGQMTNNGNNSSLRFDADRMKNETGCAAVAAARAALGRPYVFCEQSTQNITNRQSRPEQSEGSKLQIKNNDNSSQFSILNSRFSLNSVIIKHISILQKYYPENFIVVHMRHHLHKYLRDIPGARTLRVKINNTASLDELVELVNYKI